ncbi:MAG: WD40/YVTN/BNR-like repeat-containing protein, partial [Myxococcales bacterium]
SYRALSPHSFAELDGAVYFLEYQVFTGSSTTIRLWKSLDRGATWAVQSTFTSHRHGHGLMPDPARHALWAFFGDTDAQSGLYRSTDGGASWAAIKAGTQAGDIVDGTILSDGSFLCGQDISYTGSTPNKPQVARIALNGVETDYVTLPSASYSTHAVKSIGGFVVGTTHEEGADVEASGWTRGSLWGSGDGLHWQQILTVSQASAGGDVRCDVYWELPGGELVLTVNNAAGFGPGGRGFLLLRPSRQ